MNAHREVVADVYVKDGIIVAVKPNIKVLSFLLKCCSYVNLLSALF